MELAYRLAVRGLAAHQPDPRQRHRVDHARRPSRTGATATSTGTTPTRSTRQARATASAGRRTGASTSSTTTTATSTTRRSRMRAILDWYLQWHPPIMHDLHESVPFLYTFSGQAPQNPTLDPILYGELPWFANFEMAQMIKYGMPGVWTHAFVDMWSPGLPRLHVVEPQRHAAHVRDVRQRRRQHDEAPDRRRRRGRQGAGGGQTTREWYRPLPPYAEVEWSMRNNMNYMRDGRAVGAPAHVGVPEGGPRELLPQEPELHRGGQDGGAVRLRHSRRPARPDAGRVAS